MRRSLGQPPGEIPPKEGLKPIGLSPCALARAIDVPPRRIHEVVKGLRGISAGTALRPAAFFGTDAPRWIEPRTDDVIIRAQETMADVVAHIQRFNGDDARA